MKRGGSWGCEACGKGFWSLGAFDMHRVGRYDNKQGTPRRCLSTEEMIARGMRQQPNGAWTSGKASPYAA